MCGISGFIDFNKMSSGDVLKNMSATLSHRGPDGNGFFLSNTPAYSIGLAHQRLAIIDLSSSGHQPMNVNHLWITFNGEIYNFKEIKKELQANGYSFKSDSDTEVILFAFTEWGIKCIEKFIGMFAFVIYDTSKNELICVRDRAGVKPFFYYWSNNLFLFASEIKAFHKHPGFVKELNTGVLQDYLQLGVIPTQQCIFNNCFKLQPAHYLTLNLTTREIKLTEYWNVVSFYSLPKTDISFEEAGVETEKLLTSAAEYRMVSDVPVGVFLSGGYDSTLVTALLQKNRHEKLQTFTIGVNHKDLNEAPYAKEIARHLGTEHHEVYFKETEVLDFVNELPFFYDEPFADQSALATMLVSKIARRNVKVALSADGGDETFAGYNRYDYLMKQGTQFNKLPRAMRLSAASLMNKVNPAKIPFLKTKPNFNSRFKKAGSLLQDPSVQNFITNLGVNFTNDELDLLLRKRTNFKFSFNSLTTKNNLLSPLSFMMAFDYQTYLPDDILQKVDRASMSQSLEAREPLLDHRLIEWVATLPDNYKYNNGVKKYLLKEIVHKYVPREMMDRPKMGFSVPLEKWLKAELKEKVFFYLAEKRIKQQDLFSPEFIGTLIREFYSGKKEHSTKIWRLLIFQMWYEKWME